MFCWGRGAGVQLGPLKSFFKVFFSLVRGLRCIFMSTAKTCMLCAYAAVNGNLDPTLSKGRQAFGVNSTSHLHLQKIEVG